MASLEQRARLQAEGHKHLVERVRTALNGLDAGNLLEIGAPADEYELEVPLVIEALKSCGSIEDARHSIRHLFAKRLGVETTGKESRYSDAAEQIWLAWREWQDLLGRLDREYGAG